MKQECSGRLGAIREGLYCATCGQFYPVGASFIIPPDWQGEHERAASGSYLPPRLQWHFDLIALQARYSEALAQHGWSDTPAKRRYFASRI